MHSKRSKKNVVPICRLRSILMQWNEIQHIFKMISMIPFYRAHLLQMMSIWMIKSKGKWKDWGIAALRGQNHNTCHWLGAHSGINQLQGIDWHTLNISYPCTLLEQPSSAKLVGLRWITSHKFSLGTHSRVVLFRSSQGSKL